MKRAFLAAIAAMIFTVAGFAQTPTAPATHLKVGDKAPEFELNDTTGNKVKLSDFRGKKNVVLAFYVLAFTGGWATELKAYQADIAKFDANETQVIGLSMDSFASNKEFGKQLGITFPLLSDWKREVTRSYGLYNESSGYGTRGTFVIDKDGNIQHVETGRTAVDPTGAYQACDLIQKKKAVKKEQ